MALHGLHDWTVSSEHLSFLFVVFFLTLSAFSGSMRQVKLATHENIVHRIVS